MSLFQSLQHTSLLHLLSLEFMKDAVSIHQLHDIVCIHVLKKLPVPPPQVEKEDRVKMVEAKQVGDGGTLSSRTKMMEDFVCIGCDCKNK